MNRLITNSLKSAIQKTINNSQKSQIAENIEIQNRRVDLSLLGKSQRDHWWRH
jgi:hypothetical protein